MGLHLDENGKSAAAGKNPAINIRCDGTTMQLCAGEGVKTYWPNRGAHSGSLLLPHRATALFPHKLPPRIMIRPMITSAAFPTLRHSFIPESGCSIRFDHARGLCRRLGT